MKIKKIQIILRKNMKNLYFLLKDKQKIHL